MILPLTPDEAIAFADLTHDGDMRKLLVALADGRVPRFTTVYPPLVIHCTKIEEPMHCQDREEGSP